MSAASYRSLFIAAIAQSIVAASLAAQVPRSATRPDSATIATIAFMGARMLQPAQFVLDHGPDLGLTTEQTSALTSIAAAQRDSEPARRARLLAAMRAAAGKHPGGSAYAHMMSWNATPSDQAIREAACEQSELQAESMINLAHDRRAVAAVLTPEQIARLPRLEAREMMGGFRPTAPGPALTTRDGVYFEFQVERRATQLSGGAPKYPDQLREAKVEGEVLAQFVVDTTGRVEPGTVRVLKSSHALFTQAVRDALPAMQFTPAEIGGAKVRQMVQQPFVFSLPAK